MRNSKPLFTFIKILKTDFMHDNDGLIPLEAIWLTKSDDCLRECDEFILLAKSQALKVTAKTDLSGMIEAFNVFIVR